MMRVFQMSFKPMKMEKPKPDGHGVIDEYLPSNSSDGSRDRHGHGVNGVIEQVARNRKTGKWS